MEKSMVSYLSGLFLPFLLMLLWTSPARSQQTDRVLLLNGNELTGEIKRMNEGLLEFSVADILGRLRIKWEHVLRLVSDQQLDIELADGTFYFGFLVESSEEGLLRIQTEEDLIEVPVLSVAFIKPIKQQFLKNLDGSVSTGLSFSKSTDIMQFSFGSGVTYRTLKSYNDLTFNTIVNAQQGQEPKTNTDLQFVHLYFLKNRWYLQGSVSGSRNDELGIDLRTAISGGAGKRVIRTPRSQLLLAALLSGNREKRNDGDRIYNLESVGEVTFIYHDYDTPRLEIRANLSSFFSLTSFGRVRLQADARLSLEIIKDLYWDISQLYFRYDNAPSEAASSQSDFGFVTNIRFRFGRGTFEE